MKRDSLRVNSSEKDKLLLGLTLAKIRNDSSLGVQHEAWAIKQGAINKNFKKRFFVICKHSPIIFYFKDNDNRQKPKGMIKPESLDHVRPGTDPSVKARYEYFVEIVTRIRIYYIILSSAEEVKAWIIHIKHPIVESYKIQNSSASGFIAVDRRGSDLPSSPKMTFTEYASPTSVPDGSL